VGRRSPLLWFRQEIAIKHIRPVMPLLMMRASLEAQQRFAPEKRPYDLPLRLRRDAALRPDLERR
jgi:hypothetical protein